MRIKIRAVATINTFVKNLQKKTYGLKKVIYKVIEGLINCALTLLLFLSLKSREFFVTQNETPEMVKRRPATLISCDKRIGTSLLLTFLLKYSILH